MSAIFKREFKSYFLSPIGYIFVSCFMLLASVSFVGGVIQSQRASIAYVFSNINLIYMFLVSLLTMRLLSEEKSKKTDQLLMSSPVSITQIVIGKYLAAMAVYGITLLLSLAFPIIMYVFGSPSLSEIIGSYVGFILLWGVMIAIGLFMSSLTESQMIAAILSFVTLTVVYLMNSITAKITNPLIKKAVGWLSLLDRYTNFQNGILDITSVIYYLSFIFIFLFLTISVIDKRRYN